MSKIQPQGMQIARLVQKGSHTARVLAKILNAPVDEMNRDYVLQKMQDTAYRNNIQKNILNLLESLSIDEFGKTLDLTPGGFLWVPL